MKEWITRAVSGDEKWQSLKTLAQTTGYGVGI